MCQRLVDDVDDKMQLRFTQKNMLYLKDLIWLCQLSDYCDSFIPELPEENVLEVESSESEEEESALQELREAQVLHDINLANVLH